MNQSSSLMILLLLAGETKKTENQVSNLSLFNINIESGCVWCPRTIYGNEMTTRELTRVPTFLFHTSLKKLNSEDTELDEAFPRKRTNKRCRLKIIRCFVQNNPPPDFKVFVSSIFVKLTCIILRQVTKNNNLLI